MTQHDLINRLQERDPAAGRTSDEDLEQELRRVLALPREERRPSHRPRRRVALVAAGVGVATAGAIALPGSSDGPGVAARAYAAVAVQDGVLHSVRRLTTVGEPATAARPARVVEVERWQRGEDLRIVIRDAGAVVEQTLVDGRLTIELPDGTVQRSGEGELGEAVADVATRIGVDPVTDFRAAYAEDDLTEAGRTTFAGREAVRFVLPDRRERLADGELTTQREFLVDADSGVPLGSRYAQESAARPGAPDVRYVTTTEIERLERLPPTEANLALLEPQQQR